MSNLVVRWVWLVVLMMPTLAMAAQSGSSSSGVPANQARGWEIVSQAGAPHVVLRTSRLLLTPPRWFIRNFFIPFEHLVSWVDDRAVVERVVDFLYNDARTAGVVPVANSRNELGPSAGIKAFHLDLLGHGEEIAARTDYGGKHFHLLEFGFESVQFGGAPVWVEIHLRREAHPSLPFSGYGMHGRGFSGGLRDPRDAKVDTRYSERRDLAALRTGYGSASRGRRLKAGLSWIYTRQTFSRSRRALSGTPSIEQVYDISRLERFQGGVDTHEVTLDVEVNLTNRRGHPSRGTTWEVYVGGVPRQRGVSYLHYGAVTAAYLNLFRETRVLVLKGALEAVDEHRGGIIPFSALPRLGGARTLRGYKRGTFRDRQVVSGTVEYRYPVHDKVLGEVYADLGSAGLSYRQLGSTWKAGYGFGFLLGAKDATNVKLDLSYGDGFEFFVSFDPARAFHERTRRL